MNMWINTPLAIYSEAASRDFEIILTLFLPTLNKSVLIKFQNDHIVSSIVKWGYQDNFKPVYFFFLRKDFAHKKILHKQKSTIKTKIS